MRQFDKSYWERHWVTAEGDRDLRLPVHPYLLVETAGLPTGEALDAGCGAGAEALWLAEHSWQVTAVDISATALATARVRAADAGLDSRIEWVEADLGRWVPERQWGLVVTSYAHGDTGQLAFYRRISSWVAPGGTLLIVGHSHGPDHPDDAATTLTEITRLFTDPDWRIESSYANARTLHAGSGPVQLRDVVVRASRLL
ncbi:SAM-dependent methyltransferase [Plantibacter sp. Mn2098]|uniref:SAM-dependent methyltransferase n=1 Tax=Plantibacter sp. Mn2098 TaxID=3395266 RepID=UPI003BC3E690